MNTEQIKAVLVVLKNMQTCISTQDTYLPGVGDWDNKDDDYRSPFNLSVAGSVCWHVYAHTNGDLGIGYDFLKPVFLKLGYKDCDYPVESTLMPNGSIEEWLQYRHKTNPYNLYFKDIEECKIRCKLVDQLVEYFENKLK